MKKLILAVLAILCSSMANAGPVRWDFDNIQLWDPGLSLNLLAGGFLYDADTAAVSNVSITGLPGSGSLSFGFDASGDGSAIYFLESAVTTIAELEAYTGDAMLMTFAGPLTNAGGTTAPVDGDIPPDFAGLNLTEYGTCSAFDDCFIFGVYDTTYDPLSYDGGTLIGTIVPVPAAVWLFGSAMAWLGWISRRQADSA
jgi:hypothetical protein